LLRLLDHPSAHSFNITALVRDTEKAAKFEKHGVKVVIGSLEDSEKIEQVASESDVVIALVRYIRQALNITKKNLRLRSTQERPRPF
jgi:uncharacterized protein YbjT (DUF2867 family)